MPMELYRIREENIVLGNFEAGDTWAILEAVGRDVSANDNWQRKTGLSCAT